ncbi:MAG: hypothetical protein P8Y70_10595 [Candidatus Lokiarchaeota archaeon]
MSTERKINPFSVIILVIGIIGLIMVLIGPFAGFYLTGPYAGNRYSCLFGCEYWTTADLIAQIIIIIFLLLQIFFAVNDLLPNKIIDKNFDKLGLVSALIIILFAIIGIAAFGIYYSEFYWWAESGFYGGIVAGIINMILFFLKIKNK